MLAPGSWERGDELDVELDAVAGQRLLIAFPAAVVAFVALGGREPTQLEPFEDAPHARGADLDVVVALEVHGDPGRAEVVVLAQIDDLAHDLGVGGVRAHPRAVGAISEPVQAGRHSGVSRCREIWRLMP